MSDTHEKFKRLTALPYNEQAIWFLNGFWGDGIGSEEANQVWKYIEKFVELDLMGPDRKGEKGNELDVFWSAKFLEDMDKAITAKERKEALKTIDHDNNGRMAAIEYLIWRYKKSVDECADAPQGDNTAAIAAAQKKLEQVMNQLKECESALERQKEAKKANEAAQRDLEKQEADLKVAEAELQEAIADLKRQEEEYQGKIKTLEDKIANPSTSGMQKARANNELAQLKSEDPLPLRRAKITQEAALRKVKKQQKAVVEAKAELARKAEALAKAISDLEDSYKKLEAKMQEAREELEKVKSKPGGGKGAIWWLERQLFEADSRLPTSRMKYDHSKPFDFNP